VSFDTPLVPTTTCPTQPCNPHYINLLSHCQNLRSCKMHVINRPCIRHRNRRQPTKLQAAFTNLMSVDHSQGK